MSCHSNAEMKQAAATVTVADVAVLIAVGTA